MERELTCIVCPMGCLLEVEIKDDQVLAISGNNCKRGAKYAVSECTNPKRILMTSLKCENGSLISVKTDNAIPKDRIFEAMQKINGTIVKLPVAVGDILIKNVFGSNVVATQNKR